MHRLPRLAILATVLATPAIAQAQSNITIYGLIDINIGYEKSGDQRHEGVDHGELNGSRLGFRGTEDLGDGLKALFVLESGYDPSRGTSEQGGRLFGRQSYVGLENHLGRVTLGRQYSPNFVAIDPFDATGSADRSVGLLSRKAGGVRPAYEVRFDNMIKYRSPKIAGFELDAGYWWGEQPGETSEARDLGDGYGITLLYGQGPIAGSLTTQEIQRDATGGKVRTSGLGLSYDFGPLKAFFAMTHDSESGTIGDGDADTWDIGAEIKAGPSGKVAISYAERDESDGDAGEDAHGWSAYYMHDLSKRTTLYAGYSYLTNEGDANYAIGNLTPEPGDNHRVMMAGMRHRF
jgi:predicted porin